MKKPMFNLLRLIALTLMVGQLEAAELKVGDAAPAFTIQTHEGKVFDIASRKGSWTVLYFYPKADTPGCTKQACTFRDNIKRIRGTGAEVFGVSADSVSDQKAFHKKHHLNFTLLADEEGKVVHLFGSQMKEDGKMSRRWTYVIDPQLKIQKISKDVDPVIDSEKIALQIAELQQKK